MLVMVGLQYAKKYGMCMMTLTGQQRHELHPMLDLTSKQEVIELTDYVGEDNCVGDLAQQRALSRNQKPQFYHSNCEAVKTLKHMHLFDANGSSLPSLHHTMVRTFDHRMLPYEFPQILPGKKTEYNYAFLHLYLLAVHQRLKHCQHKPNNLIIYQLLYSDLCLFGEAEVEVEAERGLHCRLFLMMRVITNRR
jgi:hypothetical protein